jgi:hypothetical protein
MVKCKFVRTWNITAYPDVAFVKNNISLKIQEYYRKDWGCLMEAFVFGLKMRASTDVLIKYIYLKGEVH